MTELTYRLSIAPDLEPFRHEIEHVCTFLDECYFVKRTADAQRVLHYGPGAPAGAVSVPAVLFPSGVRLDGKGIHPERTALKTMVRSGALLPPEASTQPSAALPYDALGLIFFMLSRVEERDHPERDRYHRFPYTAALIAPQNDRLYPFADRAARDIATVLTGESDPAPRTRYEVLFTHDIDTLRGYHRAFDPLRNAVGDIVKRFNPAAAARRIYDAYFRGEPWSSVRRLMDLSERLGIKSHFYVMGPSEDFMDSTYIMRLPKLLRKVTDEIRARGHALGFHPGFLTYNDPAEWMRQRNGVEAVVGLPLREGRHHVLRYDCAITPRIWSDAGMTFDCTLAYPELVGFRSGTCRPHRAYDLVARQTLPLKQLSTAIMEFGLFDGRYKSIPVEEGVAHGAWAIDVCRKYHGTFGVVFHSGQHDRRLWNWANAMMDLAVATPGRNH